MIAFETYKQTEIGKEKLRRACENAWGKPFKIREEYPIANLLEFFRRQGKRGKYYFV